MAVKEDMTVQHLSALLTYVTKKPVKMKLTRAESLLVHPKRHPFYMDMTMGCDENGNIMGVKAKVAADTGAFASLGGPVLERACTHAAGPYHYETLKLRERLTIPIIRRQEHFADSELPRPVLRQRHF